MNEENGGVIAKAKKGIAPHWIFIIVGAAIRMIFVAAGIWSSSFVLVGTTSGWRYIVVGALCGATYALGSIIEFAGDTMLKMKKGKE